MTPPVGVVAPLGTEVTFNCTTRNRVFWIIDDLQVTSTILQRALNASDIFAPLGTVNYTEFIVHTNSINNNTRVQCAAQVGLTDPPELSEEVNLVLYGKSLRVGGGGGGEHKCIDRPNGDR